MRHTAADTPARSGWVLQEKKKHTQKIRRKRAHKIWRKIQQKNQEKNRQKKMSTQEATALYMKTSEAAVTMRGRGQDTGDCYGLLFFSFTRRIAGAFLAITDYITAAS